MVWVVGFYGDGVVLLGYVDVSFYFGAPDGYVGFVVGVVVSLF